MVNWQIGKLVTGPPIYQSANITKEGDYAS